MYWEVGSSCEKRQKQTFFASKNLPFSERDKYNKTIFEYSRLDTVYFFEK